MRVKCLAKEHSRCPQAGLEPFLDFLSNSEISDRCGVDPRLDRSRGSPKKFQVLYA